MTQTITLSEAEEAAYKRGCETTQAALDKFGYSFAKNALEINHPNRLKGAFKSEAAFQYTKGCFDTLKTAKRKI